MPFSGPWTRRSASSLRPPSESGGGEGRNELDDKTLVLADLARKAPVQIQECVRDLIGDRLPPEKSKDLMASLTEGRWTHDYPIAFDKAKSLGLPVGRSSRPTCTRSWIFTRSRARADRPCSSFRCCIAASPSRRRSGRDDVGASSRPPPRLRSPARSVSAGGFSVPGVPGMLQVERPRRLLPAQHELPIESGKSIHDAGIGELGV